MKLLSVGAEVDFIEELRLRRWARENSRYFLKQTA